MKDVECPYCGEYQEINHDDGYGYEEGRTYQQECSDCDKTFAYTTSISFYYDATKADCLNDGEHDWKFLQSFPREYSRMGCVMCDEERPLTEDEKKKYL